jgi:Holliday junction resolvasome RuvABC ATP-dependent DNA helicase subunit
MMLGVDDEAVERNIEPYLIRLGLVVVTPQGRVAASPPRTRLAG